MSDVTEELVLSLVDVRDQDPTAAATAAAAAALAALRPIMRGPSSTGTGTQGPSPRTSDPPSTRTSQAGTLQPAGGAPPPQRSGENLALPPRRPLSASGKLSDRKQSSSDEQRTDQAPVPAAQAAAVGMVAMTTNGDSAGAKPRPAVAALTAPGTNSSTSPKGKPSRPPAAAAGASTIPGRGTSSSLVSKDGTSRPVSQSGADKSTTSGEAPVSGNGTAAARPPSARPKVPSPGSVAGARPPPKRTSSSSALEAAEGSVPSTSGRPPGGPSCDGGDWRSAGGGSHAAGAAAAPVSVLLRSPRSSTTSDLPPASSSRPPPAPNTNISRQPPQLQQEQQQHAPVQEASPGQRPGGPHQQPAGTSGQRAVRFTAREGSGRSGRGGGSDSPTDATGTSGQQALPALRRISDGASHVTSPGAGSSNNRSIRPSDDGVSSNRFRPAGSNNDGAFVRRPGPGSDASGVPSPATIRGSGSGVSSLLVVANSDSPTSRQPYGIAKGATGGEAGEDQGGHHGADRRSGPHGHGHRNAGGGVRPAGDGDSHGPGHGHGLAGSNSGQGALIRRAGELAPLPLPAGLDGSLREALARAAAHNVAVLAAGELLPDQDFGYARIVARHHEQERKRQQDQQQHQNHQHQGSVPPTPQPAEVPARRPSLHAIPESSTAAAPPPAPPPPGGGLAEDDTSGGATVASSSTLQPRPGRPPPGARNMRSALKNSGTFAAPGQPTSIAGEPPPPLAHLDSGGSRLGGSTAGSGPGGLYGTATANSLNSTSGRSLFRNSSACSMDDGNGASYLDSPAGVPGRGAIRTAIVSDGEAEGGATATGGLLRDLRKEENVDVRIHCVTFNMAGTAPSAGALPEALFSGSYLSPESIADAAHVYVFATQESGPLAEWEAAVAAYLGRRYRRVAVESLMSIHIVMFAVNHLVPYISEVRTSSVATGVGNVLGNKGGVAVTFGLLGAQVLLVGAHFAAHDQNVERRNADFHRICAGLFAPPSATNSGNSGALTVAAQRAVANASPGRRQQTASGGVTTGAASPAADSNPSAGPSPLQTASRATGGNVTRRYNLGQGPTLSRFSRGKALGSSGTLDTDASTGAGSGRGGGEGGGGGGGAWKALTRTLSSSSVGSMVSTASAYPTPSEVASRSRSPSFWSGISFATAQRQSNALLAHFDVVLWMGDLNYRIAGTPEVVKYAIDANFVEVLRANDQLAIQQKKGKVLQGFQEMPISFAPTYKFVPGTDSYDLRRTPAWTDRVLYLVNADPLFADLRPLYYMSIPELRTSDHRPVIAGFELSISPLHAGANHHARHKACVIS